MSRLSSRIDISTVGVLKIYGSGSRQPGVASQDWL